MKDIRYVDRTRIIQYRRCPRSRYWMTEYQGIGIVPKALSIPLTTGTHVHAGADPLFRNAMAGQELDIEAAVAVGLDGYWRDVTARGFDLEENEVAAEVAKEQAALTEALIRLMGMKVVPWLLADGYKILAVELECEWEIAPGLVMMGRPDAVMLHEPTEEIHLLSLKTKKSWDSRADKANSHDDQGISETVCFEADNKEAWEKYTELGFNGRKVQAVVMPHLLKGDRRKDKVTGQYTQACPLIRGWRQENRGETRHAHSYQWKDEFGTRKLAMNGGSKWESFNAWEQPGGVKWWMEQLATGTIQPEAGDPLAQSVMIPTPYYRQEADIESWKEQVRQQEIEISCHLELPLDTVFPQYRHSCHYPGDCSYLDLCYGPPQMAEDPMATERFMWRIPHHELESNQRLVQISEVE